MWARGAKPRGIQKHIRQNRGPWTPSVPLVRPLQEPVPQHRRRVSRGPGASFHQALIPCKLQADIISTSRTWGKAGKPLLPLGSDLIKCSRRRVQPGLEGGARPKSLPGVCVNRARQVPWEDPGAGGGVFLLFPLISTNNKVNTFTTCVPRLVSEKDTHAAFGEMSGRARDPWLHRKLSG